MAVPLGARDVAGAVGAVLVLVAGKSVVGTIVVPRGVHSWLTVGVDRVVDATFHTVAHVFPEHSTRDRILAAQAPALLLAQLATWLGVLLCGFALLLWPMTDGGVGHAFSVAAGAMFLGGTAGTAAAATAVQVIAALTALVTIALQIGYLPALYSAFNRRETEVSLLNARAGVPSWGPELLARTHYGLGTGISTVHTLGGLYETWERWAADVAESHVTYLPLVRFRSPKYLASWVTSLLAVLDSAALYLALCPLSVPEIPARLCLRGGFRCFGEVARALGIDVPEEADPEAGISLTYEDFELAVARLREVDFPIEREPREAWPHFAGWRVNYERSAYAVARAVDAVPALWSGPRRDDVTPIAPIRPPTGPVRH